MCLSDPQCFQNACLLKNLQNDAEHRIRKRQPAYHCYFMIFEILRFHAPQVHINSFEISALREIRRFSSALTQRPICLLALFQRLISVLRKIHIPDQHLNLSAPLKLIDVQLIDDIRAFSRLQLHLSPGMPEKHCRYRRMPVPCEYFSMLSTAHGSDI